MSSTTAGPGSGVETLAPWRAPEGEGLAKRDGRMATADGRLVGSDGKLYAHGSTTCFLFDAP